MVLSFCVVEKLHGLYLGNGEGEFIAKNCDYTLVTRFMMLYNMSQQFHAFSLRKISIFISYPD